MRQRSRRDCTKKPKRSIVEGAEARTAVAAPKVSPLCSPACLSCPTEAGNVIMLGRRNRRCFLSQQHQSLVYGRLVGRLVSYVDCRLGDGHAAIIIVKQHKRIKAKTDERERDKVKKIGYFQLFIFVLEKQKDLNHIFLNKIDATKNKSPEFIGTLRSVEQVAGIEPV